MIYYSSEQLIDMLNKIFEFSGGAILKGANDSGEWNLFDFGEDQAILELLEDCEDESEIFITNEDLVFVKQDFNWLLEVRE